MGFRFRRRIRVLPGVSLNVGKSRFTSLTAGIRGFTVNFGRKGSRTTTSLPGTGLSYQSPVRHHNASDRGAGTTPGMRRGSGVWRAARALGRRSFATTRQAARDLDVRDRIIVCLSGLA
jgi:hypothetical protein